MASNNVDFLPVKKPHQDKPLTLHEQSEWKKCKKDVFYFMRTYCMVMSPGVGSCLFDPRDYQIEMLQDIIDNRKSVINAPR